MRRKLGGAILLSDAAGNCLVCLVTCHVIVHQSTSSRLATPPLRRRRPNLYQFEVNAISIRFCRFAVTPGADCIQFRFTSAAVTRSVVGALCNDGRLPDIDDDDEVYFRKTVRALVSHFLSRFHNCCMLCDLNTACKTNK